jgi:chromosome segregation ATPase
MICPCGTCAAIASQTRCVWEESAVSKRKTSSSKSRGPLAGTALGDIVDTGQAMISEAQDRATDAVQQVTRMASDAASTLDKRREVELKNLRGRVRDVNTAIGGLERRYRTLEQRLTKQIETLSGRTVKASDLDKRIRALEAEIRRATGLGAAAAGSARRSAATTTRTASRTASRAATGARKATSTARRSAAARTSSRGNAGKAAQAGTTAAKRTARTASTAAKKTARTASTAAKKTTRTTSTAARKTTRRATGAARTAGTAVSTAARAASTGAQAGATSARRSAAGSAGGRKTAARAKPKATTRKAAPRSKTSSNGTGGS